MDMAGQMRSYGEGCEGMDASFWGELQNHIDLAMVYAKLPIGDFFRLRLVCKEWNRLASDRGFLEEVFRDPILKPYFVVGTWKMKCRLLTYDGSSRRWNWTRIPYAPSEVEGAFREDFYSNRIFNVHTRVFYDPPPPPLYDGIDQSDPLLGITVDTSMRPYSFQLILGEEFFDTQIYHSQSDSWTCNDSELLVVVYEDRWKISYAQCNGVLYFRGRGVDLQWYDLEREVWNYDSPAVPDDVPDDEWLFHDIGAWQDHLFFFGVKKSQSSCQIMVLELANHSEDLSWTLFDRMPENLCLWMLAGQEENLDAGWAQEEFLDDGRARVMDMQSIFSGEHVLVYNCVGLEEVTERAVLYNLDRKTWETVELPGPRRLLWSEADNDLSERLVMAVLNRNATRQNLAMSESEGEHSL